MYVQSDLYSNMQGQWTVLLQHTLDCSLLINVHLQSTLWPRLSRHAHQRCPTLPPASAKMALPWSLTTPGAAQLPQSGPTALSHLRHSRSCRAQARPAPHHKQVGPLSDQACRLGGVFGACRQKRQCAGSDLAMFSNLASLQAALAMLLERSSLHHRTQAKS